MNQDSQLCILLNNTDFLENISYTCEGQKFSFFPDSLLESRNNLVYLTKKIIYEQFKKQVVRDTDQVFIDYGVNKTNSEKINFDDFFKNRSDVILEMEAMLLNDTNSMIENTKEIHEKEEKKKLLSNFIEQIDKKNWYFFCFQADSETKIKMMENLNEILVKLLFIANIADYLALLLMELAQNAEKSHYEWMTEKYFTKINKEEFIKNKNNRELIRQTMQKEKKCLKLIIELSEYNGNKLTVSLINKGILEQKIQTHLTHKMDQSNSQKPLSDYFQESANMLGAGLGLFYVSYIKTECEKNGLFFNAYVQSDYDHEEVISTFELII